MLEDVTLKFCMKIEAGRQFVGLSSDKDGTINTRKKSFI